MEKNICYRQRRRKEVVYDDCVLEDSLSQGDWHIDEDPFVDYEMLLGGLRACAERISKPRTTNLDRISKTTKELLERRITWRFDFNASLIERLVANTSCRKAFQENLSKYRQKKVLEAAQRRTSLKKCRRDLREHNIPLAALLSEDGTRTSSRREMEIIIIIIRRGSTRTFSVHQLLCQAQSSLLAKFHHGFSLRKYESLLRAWNLTQHRP
ncbi:hypothetical protein RB195_025113 [Necator americanus]|uniref:Uncharacterized protein n=1 Tax=Necator americanus TaxID=51031 RepID=A0ABR1EQZ0_NECAM